MVVVEIWRSGLEKFGIFDCGAGTESEKPWRGSARKAALPVRKSRLASALGGTEQDAKDLEI